MGMQIESYKQAEVEAQWDAIVIGSGIGGLATAAMLGMHKQMRVLALERHYVAGGFTHTFCRPGFQWDVGVHYVGDVGEKRQTIRRVFDHLTAGKLEWAAMPRVYDRVEMAGRRFDFVAGKENLRAALQEAFAQERAVIDRYFAAVERSNKAMQLYSAEKSIPAAVSAVVGGLMRRGALKWAGRTTREVIEGLGASAELLGVLTAQWGDYGLPPSESSFAIHALVAAHYFEGGYYPVGGAEAIAQTIVPQITAAGGRVVVNAEVERILIEAGRAVGVRMVDGRELRAPVVVSDAGAVNTFGKLVRESTPQLDALRAEIEAMPRSTAHVCLYLGLDRTAEELGLTGTNLWFSDEFDHDAAVRKQRASSRLEMESSYVSFPSAKDPDFLNRCPGKATMEVLTLVPFDVFEQWSETRWRKRGAEYDALKEELSARLLAIALKAAPQIEGHVECVELSTPLSTKHFSNCMKGEIYGIAATPKKYLSRRLGARTPVKGLYLTGTDALSLGVAGAMMGGIVAASLILKGNYVSVAMRGARE